MKLLLAALLALAAMTMSALPVSAAYNPFGGVCNGQDVQKSAVCNQDDKGNPIAGPNGILIQVTNIIALVAGAAAVIVLLVASIKYITSQGDSNGVSSAKNTIIYALIGIVVIVLARSILVFIVSRIK